jgi:hypothetical protein
MSDMQGGLIVADEFATADVPAQTACGRAKVTLIGTR